MMGYTASFLVKIYPGPHASQPGATMHSNELILNKLLSTLHERFAINIDHVTAASRLSDLGIDSLYLIDIMLDMENEFSFHFEPLLLPPNPSLAQISLAIMKDSHAPG
jgi:acyl carrier protein